MSVERAPELSSQMQDAIEELKGLVRQRYPDATFRVTRSPEDPETILLKPVVDVDDRDEVLSLVLDRLGELQIEEQLQLFVVPLRPPARNEAIRHRLKQASPAWGVQHLPLRP